MGYGESTGMRVEGVARCNAPDHASHTAGGDGARFSMEFAVEAMAAWAGISGILADGHTSRQACPQHVRSFKWPYGYEESAKPFEESLQKS